MQSSPPSRWPASAIAISAVLALLLVASGVWIAFTTARVAELRADLTGVRSALAASEARIADLERELASGPDQPPGGLGELLGGSGEGFGLDDLLGLLGAEGGEGYPGDLAELLKGLLGDESADLGGLLGGLGGGLRSGLDSCLLDTPASFVISDADLDRQVADIAAAVEEVRDLTYPGSINLVFVPVGQMGERVRALALADAAPELVDFSTRLLIALGMLPPGYDLAEAQLELLDAGVAGYYDPANRQLVVATPRAGGPLAAVDQVALAHEMIHALTDARLNFPAAIEDPLADPDRARAVQALIEGDATLGMHQFSLGALDLADQFGLILDPRVRGARQTADEYPYVLSTGLQLPYLEGLAFTCHLYAGGGWPAVNRAYDHPPTSTSQVLFPELYDSGTAAVAPAAVPAPGTGWEPIGRTSFGAADLLMLFSAPGGHPEAALAQARERTRAWGGGEAAVWARGAESAIGLSLVDGGAGPEPLCDSMTEWGRSTFAGLAAEEPAGDQQLTLSGTDRAVVASCRGGQVRVGVAPDSDTAAFIATARS